MESARSKILTGEGLSRPHKNLPECESRPRQSNENPYGAHVTLPGTSILLLL